MEYEQDVNYGQQVITRFEKLSNHFKSAQIYTPSIVEENARPFYQFYKEEADSVKVETASLQWMVADDPVQKKRVDSIAKHIISLLPVLMLNNPMQLVEKSMYAHLKKVTLIHTKINEGIQYERVKLETLTKSLDESMNLTRILTVLFSVVAVLILVITFFTTFFLNRKRQWLEVFLTSILNTTPNGVITFKAIRNNNKIENFEIEYANKAIEKLLNLRPQNVVGKTLDAFPLAVQQQDLFEQFKNVVEKNKKSAFEMPLKVGFRHRWFYIMLARMEDGITATFHDITVMKKYEDDLKKNIRKLEHSNKELEQYAYAASHDLQEPLRKIRLYISRLNETMQEKMDEKEQHDMERIMVAAERMSVLIKDILSFSSMNQDTSFEHTDLNSILQYVLNDQELLIAQKQAVVHADPLPSIDAIPLQMNQLFYNLLNNALKFGRPGIPLQLYIKCSEVTAGDLHELKLPAHKSFIQLEFSDNGEGFSEEFSEQIFGLFKRLGNKQQVHGSGIGLALCRKVVENHNGHIYARGKVDHGATFYIILPVKQKSGESTEVPPALSINTSTSE